MFEDEVSRSLNLTLSDNFSLFLGVSPDGRRWVLLALTRPYEALDHARNMGAIDDEDGDGFPPARE